MIKEYDVIKTVKDLNEKVKIGTVGTVLIIHSTFPPVYEVEFFDDRNEHLDLLTVVGDSVIKLHT